MGIIMKRSQYQTGHQAGFTLVELSIVLVIIGLIVGGVLVGQDMIRAAEIRSTIAQVESFNTAVNTFRDKYRNIPGDILSSDAARFGFTARTGASGRGDGDRLIEALPANPAYLGHETALFWRDLAQVALIDNGFNTATDALVTAAAGTIDTYLPSAKIGLGHYIVAYSSGGRNYFEIARVASVAAGVFTLENAMNPQVAFNIDDKLDDGSPLNGSVVAAFGTAALDGVATALGAPFVGATPAAPSSPAVALDCASGAAIATVAYNTATEAAANNPACQLRVRASF
jgi:prepilin-type N-terminal cleavage/methylation domain-containing protein